MSSAVVQVLRSGDQVLLNVPDNPRLHGSRATVAVVTDWGAHVLTEAAATGGFRAGWSEMKLVSSSAPTAQASASVNGKGSTVVPLSPTGDVCSNCGGNNMQRAGACLVCADCGTSGGCG